MASKRPYPKTLAAPGAATYDVGYGKPPKGSQFKPGQSGNPRGRPKGAKHSFPQLNEERMKGIVMGEAYRTIMVRDGEWTLNIPVIQAIIRSVALSAAKGHQRSQRLFTELLRLVESENKASHDSYNRHDDVCYQRGHRRHPSDDTAPRQSGVHRHHARPGAGDPISGR